MLPVPFHGDLKNFINYLSFLEKPTDPASRPSPKPFSNMSNTSRPLSKSSAKIWRFFRCGFCEE